ncbi:MAG: flavodoxin family protein [Thermoleophilia bacterium]
MSETEIRLLGVSGSSRRKATDFAVNEALRYAQERHGVTVDYFSAHRKSIGFCVHCDGCVRKKQGCVFQDDMQELYPKLLWADAWILGTPVYQGNISGQLKTILDRCRSIVAGDLAAFADKAGAGIAVGGDRNGGQEPTLQAIIDFYLINRMTPVAGGAFGTNLGAAVWSRDKGAAGVQADEEGMAGIHRVVDRLVAVARRLRASASP